MENGRTTIHDTVFVEIAREAVQKMEDVFRQEKKGALTGLTRVFTDRFAPQITVKKTENAETENGFGTISLDMKITVVYGVVIPEVAKKVREKIISDIETLTGYSVERVDINIDKIVRPEQIMEEKGKPEEKDEE